MRSWAAFTPAEGGTAAYRYAYQGGQPTVVERKQGGSTTLLGWTSDGQLITVGLRDESEPGTVIELFEDGTAPFGRAKPKP